MSYLPYKEEERSRTIPQPASGGINIDTFAGQIQGVSSRNKLTRNAASLLPLFGTGNDDLSLDLLDFGQPYEVDLETPFSEKSEFSVLGYMQDPDQFNWELRFGDFSSDDGAIEPLYIRSVAEFSNIEGSNVSHTVRAHTMTGNDDFFQGADQIFPYYEINKNNTYDFFVDSSDQEGDTAGAISLPGIASGEDNVIDPFKETNKRTLITDDSEINEVLYLMTGSVEDSIVPQGFKSSTSGFVFRADGTDSIAFGGF